MAKKYLFWDAFCDIMIKNNQYKERKMKNLKGIYTALLTPFTKDGKIIVSIDMATVIEQQRKKDIQTKQCTI